MTKWKKWAAVIALAVAPLGVAACDSGDGDVEDPDQVEQQVDELEQDVRENTP
jgi:hypothetical protein